MNLIEAIENGHLEVVEKFLEYETDPNIQDKNGLTPLHRASGKGI